MKHIVHNWGSNILSIHDGIGPPFVIPTKKNEIFHEKIICSEQPKMQNKHQSFFQFSKNPSFSGENAFPDLLFASNGFFLTLALFQNQRSRWPLCPSYRLAPTNISLKRGFFNFQSREGGAVGSCFSIIPHSCNFFTLTHFCPEYFACKSA